MCLVRACASRANGQQKLLSAPTLFRCVPACVPHTDRRTAPDIARETPAAVPAEPRPRSNGRWRHPCGETAISTQQLALGARRQEQAPGTDTRTVHTDQTAARIWQCSTTRAPTRTLQRAGDRGRTGDLVLGKERNPGRHTIARHRTHKGRAWRWGVRATEWAAMGTRSGTHPVHTRTHDRAPPDGRE
jgi:hypothetical protein